MFTIQISSLQIEISLRNEKMKQKRLSKLIKAQEIEKDIEALKVKYAYPARLM